MRQVGRLVAAVDDARHHFVFKICANCVARLERLPWRLQRRQLDLAIGQLARHPERYQAPVFFHSAHEATIYCRLEAEQLSGMIH
jgi:hypothetical protein